MAYYKWGNSPSHSRPLARRRTIYVVGSFYRLLFSLEAHRVIGTSQLGCAKMSSNHWEEACAQIIHESTLSKVWPIKVPRKVGVVRTSKTMAWHIWKSTDRYIFGFRPANKSDEPTTDATAATFYLALQRRKSRGQNKEAVVLTQGQEPTNVTALDDARVFQAVPGLSGRALLRHVATGRYLYLRTGDRLSFTDMESMAGGWEIDLQL